MAQQQLVLWHGVATWESSSYLTDFHQSESACVRELALLLFNEDRLFSDDDVEAWLPPSQWLATLARAKHLMKRSTLCDRQLVSKPSNAAIYDAIADFPVWSFELLDFLCKIAGNPGYGTDWYFVVEQGQVQPLEKVELL